MKTKKDRKTEIKPDYQVVAKSPTHVLGNLEISTENGIKYRCSMTLTQVLGIFKTDSGNH